MPICFKKTTVFFLYFLIKIIIFTLKIYLFAPKIAFKSFFYNETCKEFRRNQFFSNIFTFLSVICQNFEGNLRILANFGKFSRKNSKTYGFHPYVLKKLQFFFVFFNKDYNFYTKNLFIRPKIAFKAFFTTKNTKSFVKINFLITFLHS